jgi:hypothetical protein
MRVGCACWTNHRKRSTDVRHMCRREFWLRLLVAPGLARVDRMHTPAALLLRHCCCCCWLLLLLLCLVLLVNVCSGQRCMVAHASPHALQCTNILTVYVLCRRLLHTFWMFRQPNICHVHTLGDLQGLICQIKLHLVNGNMLLLLTAKGTRNLQQAQQLIQL